MKLRNNEHISYCQSQWSLNPEGLKSKIHQTEWNRIKSGPSLSKTYLFSSPLLFLSGCRRSGWSTGRAGRFQLLVKLCYWSQCRDRRANKEPTTRHVSVSLGRCRFWRNTRRQRRTGEWSTTQTPKQNHLCETIKDKCEAPGSPIKSGGVPSNDSHMRACCFLSFYQTFINLLQTNSCLCVFSFAGWWRRTRRERIGTFTCTKHHNHITTLQFTSLYKVLLCFLTLLQLQEIF